MGLSVSTQEEVQRRTTIPVRARLMAAAGVEGCRDRAGENRDRSRPPLRAPRSPALLHPQGYLVGLAAPRVEVPQAKCSGAGAGLPRRRSSVMFRALFSGDSFFNEGLER